MPKRLMFGQHRTIADCHDVLVKGRRMMAPREGMPRVVDPAAAALREAGMPMSHPAFWVAAGAAISQFATAPLVWWDRALMRRPLLSLSDYALKDIGWSRADIMSDDDRASWRARIGRPHGF